MIIIPNSSNVLTELSKIHTQLLTSSLVTVGGNYLFCVLKDENQGYRHNILTNLGHRVILPMEMRSSRNAGLLTLNQMANEVKEEDDLFQIDANGFWNGDNRYNSDFPHTEDFYVMMLRLITDVTLRNEEMDLGLRVMYTQKPQSHCKPIRHLISKGIYIRDSSLMPSKSGMTFEDFICSWVEDVGYPELDVTQ